MNTEQAQQSDASVATPAVDLSLGDYRATREPKPAKDTPKPPTPSTPEAPGSPTEELETDGTPEQQTERKKKLGGFQKTISKQSEEIAELKRQLGEKPVTPAAASAEPPAAAAKPAAAVPEPVYSVPKPKLEDCDGIEDFTEKLSDWKDAERTWRKETKETQATRQAEANALIARWNTSKDAFKEEHADYDEVVDAVKGIKLSPQHQRIFLDSEHGVALAYELAQNPDELKRIAGLSPVAAAKAIGRLEVKYSSTAEAAAPEPEVKVSSAPRPIKPVGGNATRSTPSPADMSAADYRKARETGRLT